MLDDVDSFCYLTEMTSVGPKLAEAQACTPQQLQYIHIVYSVAASAISLPKRTKCAEGISLRSLSILDLPCQTTVPHEQSLDDSISISSNLTPKAPNILVYISDKSCVLYSMCQSTAS